MEWMGYGHATIIHGTFLSWVYIETNKRTSDHHLLWENKPRSWAITCCYADPSKTLSKRQLLVIIPMSSCDKKNLSWDVLGKHNPVLARWSRQAVQPNQFGDLKEVGMYKTPPPVYWCESISWHLVEQLPIRFTMILKIGFQSPNLAKKRAAAHLLFTSPHAESHEPWSRTVRWRKLLEELRKHWTFRAKWAFPVFGHSHIQPVIKSATCYLFEQKTMHFRQWNHVKSSFFMDFIVNPTMPCQQLALAKPKRPRLWITHHAIQVDVHGLFWGFAGWSIFYWPENVQELQ